MKTKLSVILTVLVLSLALGAGSVAADTVIEHWMRGSDAYAKFFNDFIPGFEKANPGTKVNFVQLTTKESEQKFLVGMASNQQIDVFRTNPEVNLRAYAESGLLTPIDDLVERAGVDLSVYDQTALDMMTFNGKLYGLPYTIVPYPGLFYRTDIFDANGLAYPDESWTWQDDFFDAGRKLVKMGPNGDVERWAADVDVEDMQGSFGAGPLNLPEMNKSAALSQKTVDFVRFYSELYNQYNILADKGTSGFTSGATAMMSGGYWITPSLRSSIDGSFAVAPPPSGPDGRKLKWVIGALSIPKTSADPVAALRYIAYVTSFEAQREWVRRGLNPAGRNDVNGLEEFRDDPVHSQWASFFQYESSPIFWPPNLRFDEVRKAWHAAVDRAVEGQMDPRTSLEQLDQEVKGILSKPRMVVEP